MDIVQLRLQWVPLVAYQRQQARHYRDEKKSESSKKSLNLSPLPFDGRQEVATHTSFRDTDHKFTCIGVHLGIFEEFNVG